ncbi:DegV family protein [Bacillus piscicola]|uniref:DegV family protein n=1 Tax=Bacillus piscicola TaxID=1632684 RepID=UPI001F093045|nr:DegV family protein [Bacillus piscicola]
MGNIAVVTDSTAYLSEETQKEYGITVVPLSVIFGNETFAEGTEITTSTFYDKLREYPELPSTSQPALGHFVKVFENLAETHDAIITIHLSSAISGTYQTALTAGQQVENVNVYGFDSEISCAPQGYYAVEAAKMAKAGESAATILKRLDGMKQRTRAYFMVDNLNHLQRGGRLNGAQAIVGSILQIKPILHFQNKLIMPFEKVRTEKKALKRILDLFAEDADTEKPMRATVIHAKRPDKAKEMQATLAAKYPHVEIDVGTFGPVIGTHLGEGSIGIGWCLL